MNIAAKSVFFQTHADQDLLFDPSQGRNTLASGSTRTGWSGSLRALGTFFDVTANATAVKAIFDDTHLLVPYVPDLVLRGDAAVFDELPWKLAHKPVRRYDRVRRELRRQAPAPLRRGERHHLPLRRVGRPRLERLERATRRRPNLFNSKYKLGEYNYASDFHSQPEPTLAPERSFTAGAPQTLMLSIAATLGGAQ